MTATPLVGGGRRVMRLLVLLLSIPIAGSASAGILIQDPADDADPIGAAGRWNALAVTSSRSSITSGANLLTVSLAPGDRATLARASGLTSVPTAFVCTFDIGFAGVGSSKPVNQVLRVGRDFGGSLGDEPDAHTYARLAITATAKGFQLRDGSGLASAIFAGTQAVTWAINPSSTELKYSAPNGGVVVLGNDRMDVWVGRDRVISGAAVTNPGVACTDLKWFWGQGSGVVRLGHFDLHALEPASGPVSSATPAPIAAAVTPTSGGGAGDVALERPTPNPFRQTLRYSYAIGTVSTPVNIAIYDIAGRQIRLLARGARNTGVYEVQWDGVGDDGARVKRGVYFLRAAVGTNSRITRIVYLPE